MSKTWSVKQTQLNCRSALNRHSKNQEANLFKYEDCMTLQTLKTRMRVMLVSWKIATRKRRNVILNTWLRPITRPQSKLSGRNAAMIAPRLNPIKRLASRMIPFKIRAFKFPSTKQIRMRKSTKNSINKGEKFSLLTGDEYTKVHLKEITSTKVTCKCFSLH